jgi:hypothetical protein
MRFREHSHDYVPAEIEAAVKDGLILAFSECEEGKVPELRMEHIVQALKNMVPMSTAYAAQINTIVEWARTNATPVNYPENSDAPDTGVIQSGRRITRRTRTGE